jgi:rhodanese-related sulfurtransferase
MSVEDKINFNIFSQLDLVNSRLDHMQNQFLKLSETFERLIEIQKAQLIQVKNRQHLSDDAILHGRSYYDLTPEKAYEYYLNENKNFMVVDVADDYYERPVKLAEAIEVQVANLENNHYELPSRSTPILVISEDGTKSILACERLNQMGYYLVFNVSGGYKFWPAVREMDADESNLSNILSMKVA